MDSFGLRVLVHASRTAEQAGADFVLTTVPEPVHQALELSGLLPDFLVFDNLTQAKVTAKATAKVEVEVEVDKQ